MAYASGLRYRDGKLQPKAPHDYDYFLTPPEALTYLHWPDLQRWQMLKEPPSKKDLETWPLLSPAFFQLGLKHGRPVAPVLTVQDSVRITLEAPPEIMVTAMTMKVDKGTITFDQKHTLVHARDRSVEVRAVFPKGGTYDLWISAHKRGAPAGESALVQTYHIHAKGNKDVAPFPEIYRDFVERKAFLYEPTQKHLTPMKPQLFMLVLPEATEVFVENDGMRTPLQKRGELFVAEISLAAGDVKVGAAFAGDDKRVWYVAQFIAK